MIHTFELPDILHDKLPEMSNDDARLKPLLRVFATINCFTDFTAKAVQEHHYLLAGRCFLLADMMYKNGDRIIRSLIKHSFIPTLPSFMPSEDREKTFIKSLIPVSLYQLYEQELEDTQ